ncbi:M48 family metallopeptidase [Fluviicola chungangensis]|uniref:M48 family metalloprotease n=1 Tax=Fluviicola chungangensis TaxID=2597671 RepID=A0A556N0Z5_9FLAO|nr:M48 family metallopeptidase [Fluviicola chungangensis]TSJ45753.1 M48 family metalloprotease [Fluviicola chungangensis]
MTNKGTNLLFGALMLLFQTVGQGDFNHYKSLCSKGPVPVDFSSSTLAKIKRDQREDLKSLNYKKREFFVEQINYSIDEILHSGNVTFGDTISNYLQQLGDRLVANETDLSGKLRFYVYNSTEANAFSTRQGIVFVTTGLIAQLTSEAQLAFVISHEIIHYQEHHVLDLFEHAIKEKFYSYNERARFLSNYSRENELEADRLAVKMVHDAGYKSSEINKTFDVLLYSYLPFEEMKLDKTYFNTREMYVPEMYFDFKRNEISAKFKYNDYLMSHPNLAKRKEQVTDQIDKFKNWDKELLYEDSLQFYYIRDVARFEYVLNKVYADEPVEALYAIYILEKKYPGSSFLNTCKSQAWLDIMKTTIKKEGTAYTEYTSLNRKKMKHHEGQISVLNQFINVLPKTGKLAMGLRIIYDVYQSDTTNPVAKSCYETAIRLVVKSDDFEPEKFSTTNFSETLAYLENLKQDTSSKSKLHAVEWDKYTIIENQSKGVTEDFGIDSSKFFMYGIADIIRDSNFMKEFRRFSLEKGIIDKDRDEFNLMTDAEQEEHEYFKYDNAVHLEMDTMLIFQPAIFETTRSSEVDVYKTFKTRDLVFKEIYSTAADLNIHLKSLSLKDLEMLRAEDWNDYSLLQRSLTRAIADYENDYFVLDIADLHVIHSRLKTEKLLFLEYQHSFAPDLYAGNVVLFTVLLPVGLVYFPIALLSGHYSDWQFYVLDLKTGELALERSYYVNEPASRHSIGSRLNGLFHQLKQGKE